MLGLDLVLLISEQAWNLDLGLNFYTHYLIFVLFLSFLVLCRPQWISWKYFWGFLEISWLSAWLVVTLDMKALLWVWFVPVRIRISWSLAGSELSHKRMEKKGFSKENRWILRGGRFFMSMTRFSNYAHCLPRIYISRILTSYTPFVLY